MIKKLLTWLTNMEPETTPAEAPIETPDTNLNVQDGFGTYHN